jgi:fatty acid desaturase
VVLIAAVWSAYGLVTFFWRELGWFLAAPLGAYVICMIGSLQHEAVHGHPTRSARVNEALVWLPVGLLYPYRRYKAMHLKHHNNDHLTDPDFDPESYYLDPQAWADTPAPLRAIYTVNNTFAGRMIIGPVMAAVHFLKDEIAAMGAGNREIADVWLAHCAGLVLVWLWITQVCGMAFWQYVLGMAYWGLSLTLMRSFAEHRAHDRVNCRTIIVEANPVISLMLLNNNLHMAHHAQPNMAWYKLPGYYRANRERLLADNCGYLIKGYWRIIASYGLRPKEPVPHPLPGSLKH